MQSTPKMFLALLTLATAGLAVAPATHAQSLVGTTVTGKITFNGGTTNYFDSANGYVPTGYANKTQGTSVLIADPAKEFGFADGANADSADFTGTQLTITDVASGGGTSPTTYTFTDPVFTGLSKVSDTFGGTGAVASIQGDTITIQTPLFLNSGTSSAVFNISTSALATPEPSSIAAFAFTGLGALGLALKARKRRTAA
jgi:hypothetical protein